MVRKSWQLLIAVSLIIVLTGCGKEPPKCSDEATFGLVRKIVLNQMGGTDGLSEKEIKDSMQFDLPRATSFDEKVKTYRCEARLIAGNYQLPLTYETQLDDKNEHLVMVNGILPGDLFRVKLQMVEALEKSRAPKVSAAAAAEVQVQTESATQGVRTAEPPTVDVAPAPVVVPEKLPISPALNLSPSFDCSKASTSVEKSICGEVLLGKLDGALGQNYKAMLASNIGEGAKTDLVQKQKAWLSERNQCKSSECLLSAYRARLDEVCDYPTLSGLHPVCISGADVK